MYVPRSGETWDFSRDGDVPIDSSEIRAVDTHPVNEMVGSTLGKVFAVVVVHFPFTLIIEEDPATLLRSNERVLILRGGAGVPTTTASVEEEDELLRALP